MSRSTEDALFLAALRVASAGAALVVVLIALFLVQESVPALQNIGIDRMLRDASWHPETEAADGRFYMPPMLVGTVLATLGALVVAVPLGLASALFCRFYAPPFLSRGYRSLVELLAGIPSVVYGFWGLVVLTPLLRAWQPPGQSLLAAILILALMILPTIALLTEAALAAVPASYLRGAAALGLSRWATIRGIVLPAAFSGLATAMFLAMGRALGETMAVLMVAGNVAQMPASVFEPIRTLTSNIALELGYAAGDHRAILFVSGLVLLVLTTALVLSADRMTKLQRHD
jgi:phosphate transport system permease protein